jgi:hypothetical protein
VATAHGFEPGITPPKDVEFPRRLLLTGLILDELLSFRYWFNSMKRTHLSLTETSVKGETYWLVTVPKPGGGRRKKHFKDHREAERFYQETEKLLLDHGTTALAISDRLRIDALEAQRILEPYGVTIPDAARFYANHVEAQKKAAP